MKIINEKISWIFRKCYFCGVNDQTKPNQTKPNQTKPNQIKSNQIKSNQIKPLETSYNQINNLEMKGNVVLRFVTIVRSYTNTIINNFPCLKTTCQKEKVINLIIMSDIRHWCQTMNNFFTFEIQQFKLENDVFLSGFSHNTLIVQSSIWD